MVDLTVGKKAASRAATKAVCLAANLVVSTVARKADLMAASTAWSLVELMAASLVPWRVGPMVENSADN